MPVPRLRHLMLLDRNAPLLVHHRPAGMARGQRAGVAAGGDRAASDLD
jgi:hypothetical protein